MKIALCIITFYVTLIPVFAQSPDWEWGKGLNVIGAGWGSTGRSVDTDDEGNIYVTGTYSDDTLIFYSDTLINLGSNSMFIVKYDRNGNYKWVKHASSFINANVIANDLVVDKGGNIFLAGNFNGDTLLFDNRTFLNSTHGQDEIFLAKYDSSGNLIWVRTIEGLNADQAARIDLDSGSNLYVTGYFKSYDLNFGNIHLTNPYIQASENFFIAKFDSTGNAIWAKNVFPSSWPGMVIGKDIATDKSGSSYVAGIFSRDSVTFDNITLINPARSYFAMFITKYDNAGNVIWARTIPDSSNNYGRPLNVACDDNGHVYMGGLFQNSFIAFDGDTIWKIGSSNMFIFQFDASGHENWGIRNGQNFLDLIHRIETDSSGNLLVTGEFNTELQFSTDTLQAIDHDFFVIKYDVNGEEKWAKSFTGSNSTTGEGIAFNKQGNVFITGAFGGNEIVLGNDTLPDQSSVINYFLADISFMIVDHSSEIICLGDSVQLTATGASTYSWMPSTGLSSTTDSIVIAAPYVTTIYTITGSRVGYVSTTTAEIKVNPLPPIPVIFTQGTTLISQSGWLNQWYSNDTIIAGATSNQYDIPLPIYFMQCYSVKHTNSFGCFLISDTICITAIGIDEFGSDNFIKVYPNPTSDFLMVESADLETKFKICNIIGDVMVENKIYDGDIKVDLRSLLPGIYILHVENSKSYKFIKL